jgi:hypothetical protein
VPPIEVAMDEVGVGVASQWPVASSQCLGCNSGGAVPEQWWWRGVRAPLWFPVRSCVMWLSGAGSGLVVGGAELNRPMKTGWVQPPHKIHQVQNSHGVIYIYIIYTRV